MNIANIVRNLVENHHPSIDKIKENGFNTDIAFILNNENILIFFKDAKSRDKAHDVLIAYMNSVDSKRNDSTAYVDVLAKHGIESAAISATGVPALGGVAMQIKVDIRNSDNIEPEKKQTKEQAESKEPENITDLFDQFINDFADFIKDKINTNAPADKNESATDWKPCNNCDAKSEDECTDCDCKTCKCNDCENNDTCEMGCNECCDDDFLGECVCIDRVIYQPSKKGMATVVFFTDGTKTKAICNPNDEYNPVAGFAIALAKKFVGNDTFNELIKEYALPEEERYAGEKNSENIEYTDLDYVDVAEPVAKSEKKASSEKKTASKVSTAKKPAAKKTASTTKTAAKKPAAKKTTAKTKK